MIELQRHGSIFVLTMNAGDNRFNLESLGELSDAFAEVARADEPSAVVVTGTGKFFSNGLDLDAVQAGRVDLGELVEATQAFMARTLTFPRPTVAAINGHAFAAGAMWTLAFDRRIMRVDRGFWCLPEVDLGMPFTQGMSDLITARLTPRIANIAMVGGHRFGGDAAEEAGIVDEAVGEDEVLPTAVALAEAMAGKPAAAVAAIKTVMYQRVVESLASG